MAGENPQTGIDTGQKAPEDPNAIKGEIQRNLGSLLKSLKQGKAAGVAGSGDILESLNILRERNPQTSSLFPTEEAKIPAAGVVTPTEGQDRSASTTDQVDQIEADATKAIATTPNGVPLNPVEQVIIAYADERYEILNKTILERIEKRIERIETMLPEGVKFDPMNDDHFKLYQKALTDPRIKELEENSTKLRGISYNITKRADILHQLDNLALKQQKLEFGAGPSNETERIEKEIRSLERDLSDTEKRLTEGIGTIEAEGIPELTQFASGIRKHTDTKPEAPILAQAQTTIAEFDSSFGEVLGEDQMMVHGYKLSEVKDLNERYANAKRAIKEVGEYFSHTFSSNPARKAVLTRRLEMAIAETKSIESEYRARNTVNGILFLEELGYGAIVSVRRAKVKGVISGLRGEGVKQEEVDVAVKIPKEHEFKGAQIRTEEEEKLLKRLVQRQKELFPGTLSHFADSAIQKLPDGTPILVMEIMPEGNNLYKLNLSHSKITEEQFHDTMIKHYEALAVAHAAGVTVNDKKGADFYYFPESGRYVILDWNVTGDIQEERYKEKVDLRNGIRFFLEIGTGIAYDAIDSHPEVFKTGSFKKMKLLMNRLSDKIDNTTAMDMIGILKNIDRLTEEEIARPKT